MAGLDETSEQVAEKLRSAGEQLSEAEHIFRDETTDEHRRQWSNVYRLESATKLAQALLAVSDPQVTLPDAAAEVLASATQARQAIREAVDSGGGDLIGSANRLLTAVSAIAPGPISPDAMRNIEKIRKEIESAKTKIEAQISEAGSQVAGRKDQALASIDEDVEVVSTRRQAAEQQARELGIKTSAIAAENLAEAYGVVAKETEKQAKRYTVASFLTYLFSIAVAGAGIYISARRTSEVETFVARAAVGVPFALLGGYITSLATTHRREAWRLRHIELQIKTANPFLGLLDPGRREETLAALAIRFFPGQEGVSFGGDAHESTPELISLLRQLLVQQGTSSTQGPSASAAPQSSPQQPR